MSLHFHSMKLSIRTASILIGILSIAMSGAADDINNTSPATAESALLQGKWQGVEVGQEGNGTCTLTITGKAVSFDGRQNEEWYRATFTLPERTDPKQLLATITDCAVPEMVGKTCTAIYKIEQGKLTLTSFKPGSGKIPTSFEPDGAGRTFVFSKAAESLK